MTTLRLLWVGTPTLAGDVWMEAPDILAFTVSDAQPLYGNILDTGTPQSTAYDTWTTAANPRDGGAVENCLVVGSTKQYLKFNDLPSSAFIDRLALRDATLYSISGGLSVTAVYFRQEANSQVGQGDPGAGSNFSISQTITVYAKLSAAPSQSTVYNVSHSTSAFPPFSFTYNDKQTRAGAIRTTVGGHKPNDPLKIAYLCSRVPGNATYGDPGTHGSIDLVSTYGISSFSLIDDNGSVVFTGAPSLRCLVSDPEKIAAFTAFIDDGTGAGSPSGVAGTKMTVTAISDGYLVNGNSILGAGVTSGTLISTGATGSGTGVCTVNTSQLVNPAVAMYVTDAYTVGIDVADTSQSWTITSVTKGNPTTIGFSGGHGFTTGDGIRFRGMSGMTQIEGSPGTAKGWISQKVTVVDANTITVPIISTAFNSLTTGTYNTSLGGYENQAYKTFGTNRAGATVYGLDYSSFNTPGTYRLYIPGFGVGDPFPIAQTQFATNAALHHMGLYNQREGIALDGRAGFTRGVCLLDGVNPTNNYWSNLPNLWSTEIGLLGPASGVTLASGSGAYLVTVNGNTPMGTSNRATGSRPGHQDASDFDDVLPDHAPGFSNLAWVFEAILKLKGAASCNTPFTVPLSSAVCDQTIFAGTDSAAPLFHEMVWWAEAFRTMQNTDSTNTVLYGSVPGGYGVGHFNGQFPNDGEPISIYRGTDPNNATNGGICGAFLYAPDHLSGLYMTQMMAKLAIICYEYGFGAAGDAYKTAAALLLNWCEGIASSTTTRDNYYITHLGFLASMTAQHPTYGTTQYNADMAGFLTKYNVLRPSVFATMWRLSGMNSSGTYPTAGAPTPDWTDYGSVADSAFSSIPGVQGGWDYVQCAAYPNYSSVHATYIITSHWSDAIGGKALGPSSISNKTSFATNQYSGLGGVYPSLAAVTQHMAEVFTSNSPSTSTNLKGVLANFGFQYGANLRGMQYCTGQSPRPKSLIDDLDSWRMGLPSRKGITSFVFASTGWGTSSQSASNNFSLGAGADNSAVYCALNTTGNFETSPIFGSKKIEEPWPQGQAAWEWTPSNWELTTITEFTLAQLLSTAAAALWCHAWDGSSI